MLPAISVQNDNKFNFYRIAEIADIKNGERAFFDVEGYQIVLFNIEGEYFAIGNVCSHDEGPLGDGELDGNLIICPRHGAQFNIRTGKVLSLPAVVDIPCYPLRIDNGIIHIGIPSI